MRYLLDTNVLSDLRKRANNPLNEWFANQARADVAISAISILELERGISLKERRDPRAGAQLRRWLEIDVATAFRASILPVDERVAKVAATLHVPGPMPEMDALIAATALVHGLVLVTRNTRDFSRSGVPVIDSWGFHD
ncbi:type II toxin-antitoxin system VapC family toxin [Cutibacterium equinum]|uniref:type II toxin-antitoxin system VapC family toxin n=1 Tax=Cutibacterium equinum TaxID=3016342 RepID=UPI0038CD3242